MARETSTGGRVATTGVIPGTFALSVGNPKTPLSEGWAWTQLTDVARLESGHTPSRRRPEYWGGSVPWVGIRDATGNHGQTIYATEQQTNGLGIENSSARILPVNTVCLSRTASVGYVVMMGVPMATSQDFVNWVCGDRLNPHFLKYVLLLENPSFRMFSMGTTHQTIYFPEVKAFHIALPPRSVQDGIVEVLGAIDDKIAVNKQIGTTLEAMAAALFKSWFVNFDPVWDKVAGRDTGLPADLAMLFPAAFDANGIPDGWNIKTLPEIAVITKGRSYKSEELAASRTALVTLKSFARGGGYRRDGLKPFTGTYRPEQVVHPGEIVVACTDVTQAGEVVGRPAIVRRDARFDILVASLDTLIVRAKAGIGGEYLYQLMATDDFSSHTQGYATGTTVLHLAKEALPSYRFVLPPEAIRNAFNMEAATMMQRLYLSESEADTLVALRDALLPKLISGELYVLDARALPEAA